MAGLSGYLIRKPLQGSEEKAGLQVKVRKKATKILKKKRAEKRPGKPGRTDKNRQAWFKYNKERLPAASLLFSFSRFIESF